MANQRNEIALPWYKYRPKNCFSCKYFHSGANQWCYMFAEEPKICYLNTVKHHIETDIRSLVQDRLERELYGLGPVRIDAETLRCAPDKTRDYEALNAEINKLKSRLREANKQLDDQEQTIRRYRKLVAQRQTQVSLLSEAADTTLALDKVNNNLIKARDIAIKEQWYIIYALVGVIASMGLYLIITAL